MRGYPAYDWLHTPASAQTPGSLADVETGILRDVMADGLLQEGREGLRGLGRGAMESQCSQNQNRFKRRGQFWSRGGFASFLEASVWYTNNEIKCLYRPAA